jgi:hypothetical protein
MDRDKMMRRTIEHLHNWYYLLGFKIPMQNPSKKFVVSVDKDNMVDVERIDEQTIVIKWVCIPCLHDTLKEDEIRKLTKNEGLMKK